MCYIKLFMNPLHNRDQFASLAREVASPDVGRMGIEILSFTIKVTFYYRMTCMCSGVGVIFHSENDLLYHSACMLRLSNESTGCV